MRQTFILTVLAAIGLVTTVNLSWATDVARRPGAASIEQRMIIAFKGPNRVSSETPITRVQGSCGGVVECTARAPICCYRNLQYYCAPDTSCG